jgi:murein DD-endopeptidase MepM/ murein hydrolase activator NlpD
METPRKIRSGWPLGIGTLLLGLLLVAGVWFAAGRLEGEPPSAVLEIPAPYHIGKSAEFSLRLEDPKSGLRRMAVVLSKDGKEIALAAADFPTAGWLGLEKVHRETVKIKIDPAALGLTDGKGLLRVTVLDRSWRSWWHGNTAEVQKEIIIDTRPPVIDVLTQQNYVNQGGTGLAVFRVSESCPTTGVRVGANFYPAASGYYANKAIHIAFFALGYNQPPGTEIVLEATDLAGNVTRTRFPHFVRKKVFKKDALTVSDGFINQILPEFHALLPAKPNATLKERFLFINRDLRQMNYQTIVAATRKTEPAMLWKGPFLRLPNAAPRAGFADRRTYMYEGKEIDQQEHLGVDLASLMNSPVPAANSGVVASTGFIGIYGQTVILDHGFGLFSMYSHLSQITVKSGDRVAKDTILGNTGSTGLAGGDHLHFSMMVHDTFVDPIEWWDPHWIRDNVTSKLDGVKLSPGQG